MSKKRFEAVLLLCVLDASSKYGGQVDTYSKQYPRHLHIAPKSNLVSLRTASSVSIISKPNLSLKVHANYRTPLGCCRDHV